MKSLTLLLLFNMASLASALPETAPICLDITISGDATNEFSSYFKRELRALNDVKITEIYCNFAVVVLCSEIKLPRSTLYVVSVSVLRPSATGPATFLGQFMIWSGSIPKVAKETVLTLDTQYLEDHRLQRDATPMFPLDFQPIIDTNAVPPKLK